HKNSYKSRLYELISASLGKSAIIRRLWRHLLPKEEGFCTTSCTRGDTKGIPVTLTSKRGCEKMIYIFSQPLFGVYWL
ncbi:hypothetical protein, partial [uncultured Dialister sp.]|uniref:hypothetical protein n=1 Tax=uncultured Dialister sp. TaxID=278064 RepID=UPI00261AC97F